MDKWMYLWIHKQILLSITYHIVIIFSLLYTCHGVLYKQLSSWIIHGLLKDDCKEFFIEPVPSVEAKEEEENEEVERERERERAYACMCHIIFPINRVHYNQLIIRGDFPITKSNLLSCLVIFL